MSLLKNFFVGFLVTFSGSTFAQKTSLEALSQPIPPRIVHQRLIISGVIDRPIYEYLVREAARVSQVREIELNSFGGNVEWGLKIAETIAALHKRVVVKNGDFCASICVALFAAGTERLIGSEVWLGVHGVRLGSDETAQFLENCARKEQGEVLFNDALKDCRDFEEKSRRRLFDITRSVFGFMERRGVSPDFSLRYFSMPTDPDWMRNGNLLRIEDWMIFAEEARALNLATGVSL
jgi:hypothetical protein